MATEKIYSPLTSSSGMAQTSAPKRLRAKPYDVSTQPRSQNRGALSNLRSPTVSRTAQFPSQPPSTNNFYSSSPVLASQQSMWVASAYSEGWEQWVNLPQPEFSTAIRSPLLLSSLDSPVAQHPSSSDMKEEVKQSAPLSESEKLSLTQLHFEDYPGYVNTENVEYTHKSGNHFPHASMPSEPLKREILPQDKKEAPIMAVKMAEKEFYKVNKKDLSFTKSGRSIRREHAKYIACTNPIQDEKYQHILLDPLLKNVDFFKRPIFPKPYSKAVRECINNYYLEAKKNYPKAKKIDICANIVLHTKMSISTIEKIILGSKNKS